MLVGEVVGKTTPKEFSFKLYQEAKTHDFIAVKDQHNKWILGIIENIETLPEGDTLANCRVIGYRERNILITPKTPIKPGTLVYKANKDLISETFAFDPSGIYIGVLENNPEVKVYLEIENLISKHVAVLATTGSGKSYTVGVMIEELCDKNIPVIVIDPHGEYSSMQYPNANEENLKAFEIEPKGYNVVEYSPDITINLNAKPLKFEDKNLSPQDIIQMLPTKPTPSQIGLIYSAIKDLKQRKEDYTLEDIINEISNTDSTAKWNLINMMEVIKSTGIFDRDPTNIYEMVKKGQITIINLRGVNIDLQQLVVQRVISELFEKRKVGKIPPLFLVIEEAHNYIPEKEVTYASKVIRNVASEGRKFGFGLCVVTQRPARIDKNILSQCNTQIILRITNPNDLKAVTYAEYSFPELDKEIKNLSVGNAVILGKEVPLFVKIRARKSAHGGETPSLQGIEEDRIKVIKPLVMEEFPTNYEKIYYPFYYIRLQDGSAYLIDGVKGRQLYFKDNKPFETQPFDLNKNVFIDTTYHPRSGRIIDVKIKEKEIKSKIGEIIKDMEIIYYPYYVKDNIVIDGVLAIKKVR